MNPALTPEDFAVLVRVASEVRRTGNSRALDRWRHDANRPGVGKAYQAALEAAVKVVVRVAAGKIVELPG